MLDYQKLSSRYAVRRLGDADTDEILALCRENTQFYAYCQAQPTKEQVQSDLRLLPPGVARADKYYLGFYQGNTLIAVMDLVDGYPEKSTAFIGFFMMKKALQGQGLGSALLADAITRSLGIADSLGAKALVVDPADGAARSFYERHGFAPIPGSDRMHLPLKL